MAGIECPDCGGTEWKVSNSYRELGRIRRRRVCKSCLTPLQTFEMPRRAKYITQLADDASYRAAGTIPAGDTLARFDQEKNHD